MFSSLYVLEITCNRLGKKTKQNRCLLLKGVNAKICERASLQKLFLKPRLLVSSYSSSTLLMLETENGSGIQPGVLRLHISITDLNMVRVDLAKASHHLRSVRTNVEILYNTRCLCFFLWGPQSKGVVWLFPILEKVPKVVFQEDFFCTVVNA